MINGRLVLTFDTSVHNRMYRDGSKSDAIFAALKAGYFVRIAGLSVEEVYATPNRSARTGILASMARLQAGPNDCLLPQNELLRLLITAYDKDPNGFDWRRVNVSSQDCTRGLTDRELVENDQLASQQRQHLNDAKKEFEGVWSKLRPKLEEVIDRHSEAAPTRFQDVLPMVESKGGLVGGLGQGLYSRVASGNASQETIRDFIERCPPFRAVVYAFLLAWFDRSFGDRHKREKYRSGRVDLFMSIYLPYCDRFVSAEVNGEQEKCLCEIAGAAKLSTRVCSYDDFCNGLLISR